MLITYNKQRLKINLGHEDYDMKDGSPFTSTLRRHHKCINK